VRRWPRLRQWLEEDREILVCRQRLGFMIQEWQQTGRDDDFLLRGFDLVPGVEVCTRRTRAGFQEGAPIQEISWLHGPGRPRPKAIGPEMKGVDVSFAGTANRWRVLRCDVITKVITSGAVRSNSRLSDR
jgi:conflict system STAND superfamily ATPase